MGNRRNNHGQTLVEMAFLMPVILLILAVMLQLLLLVILHVKMHRSAIVMAEQIAWGRSPVVVQAAALVEYSRLSRWGTVIPSVSKEPLHFWRKYKGVGTIAGKNAMAVANLSYVLLGDWWAKMGIRPLILHAHAELPCEPEVVEAS